jgi:K+-transporting ATPase KdpF subunit
VNDEESDMEAMIMLAVSVATAAYLVYALLRPEKF